MLVYIFVSYSWPNGWTKLAQIFWGNPEGKKIWFFLNSVFLFHGQRRALQLVLYYYYVKVLCVMKILTTVWRIYVRMKVHVGMVLMSTSASVQQGSQVIFILHWRIFLTENIFQYGTDYSPQSLIRQSLQPDVKDRWYFKLWVPLTSIKSLHYHAAKI